MFSPARLPIRISLVVSLVAVAPISGSRIMAQESSGPAHPAELRVFDPSLIDTSVNPCENFYRYSCNGWFKRNPLPADQAVYGRFTELYELNRLHLRQILEGAASTEADTRSPNEQKIGDEYASCMDTVAINKAGLKPLKPELDRIAALRSVQDLPTLLGHLHTIGVNAFFETGATPDFANANEIISGYDAGGLGLPERDYYTRTDAKSVEQRKQYVDHVHRMFVLAGEPEAQAQKDAETVMAIETRLAKASLTITEERDPQNLNHPTHVAAMAKILTHVNLNDYVEAAHAPATGKANDT
jgi:endothelin-converting enzyme/putative endopeptidase